MVGYITPRSVYQRYMNTRGICISSQLWGGGVFFVSACVPEAFALSTSHFFFLYCTFSIHARGMQMWTTPSFKKTPLFLLYRNTHKRRDTFNCLHLTLVLFSSALKILHVRLLFNSDIFFFFFENRNQGIRVKIQNSGKNWFFWFSLLGGEN